MKPITDHLPGDVAQVLILYAVAATMLKRINRIDNEKASEEGPFNIFMYHKNYYSGQKDAYKKVLQSFFSEKHIPSKNLDELIKRIADYHKVSVIEVPSKSRKQELVEVRKWVSFFGQKNGIASAHQIGNKIMRDHSLVFFHKRRITELIQVDKEIHEKYQALKKIV